jgi:hypothetical protein
MATSPAVGALPTSIPAGITSDPTAQQEYMSALTKVIDSLEKRNQINYFNVAGQFFDPGRTGSFGESVGRASASIGRDVEAQRANAPNLALMRAQLAGQKYTLANDAKALNIISDNLGIDPREAQQSLSSGNLTQSQISKIPQLYPAIATLSPPRAEMLKNLFDMQVKGADVGIKQREANIKEDEFGAKYIPDYQIQPRGGRPQAAPAPAAAPTLPITPPVTGADTSKTDIYRFENLTPSERQRLNEQYERSGLNNNLLDRPDVATLFNGMPVDQRRAAFELSRKTGEPPATSDTQLARISPRRPGETLDAYNARVKEEAKTELGISQKSIEAREATPQKKFDLIAGYDQEMVGNTNAKLDNLYKMVNTPEGKRITSIMNKQGVLTAIAQGAESGITTPVGSLSAPALEILQKLELKPSEQNTARLIAQSISDLNMGVMKQGKDIFGPQISVYDAQKMAEPGFKNTDSSVVISSLVNKFKIMNHFQGEMNKAQQEYFERNPAAKTSQFFKSKEFFDVADQYTKTLRKLNDLSPL